MLGSKFVGNAARRAAAWAKPGVEGVKAGFSQASSLRQPAMEGVKSGLRRAGWAGSNMGKLGTYAAKGGFGGTVQAGVIGAGAGAGWGMMSEDTSVLGGALMGAGAGLAGARYGGAGLRAASGVGAGMGPAAHAKAWGMAAGKGAGKQMGVDALGVAFADYGAMWGKASGMASGAVGKGKAAYKKSVDLAQSTRQYFGNAVRANGPIAGSKVSSSLKGSSWRKSTGRGKRRAQRSAERAAYNVQGGEFGGAIRGWAQTMGY